MLGFAPELHGMITGAYNYVKPCRGVWDYGTLTVLFFSMAAFTHQVFPQASGPTITCNFVRLKNRH